MNEKLLAAPQQKFKDQLMGFNDKISRLENSRFFNNSAIAFSFDNAKGKILSVDRVIDEDGEPFIQLECRAQPENLQIHFFDLDNIEAFVLTYRMLTQNNDRYSISQLAQNYDQLDGYFGEWISHLREQNKLFLSMDSPLQFSDTPISNQELLDVVIYGHLAHSNEKKQSLFRHWTRWPNHENALWLSFDHTIRSSMQILQHFRDVNAAALTVHFGIPLSNEVVFQRLQAKRILREDAAFPLACK